MSVVICFSLIDTLLSVYVTLHHVLSLKCAQQHLLRTNSIKTHDRNIYNSIHTNTFIYFVANLTQKINLQKRVCDVYATAPDARTSAFYMQCKMQIVLYI